MKRTFYVVLALAFLFAGGIVSSPKADSLTILQPLNTWELGGTNNGANVYCQMNPCGGDNDFMLFKVENTTGSTQTVVFHCEVSETGKTSSTYNNITVVVQAGSSTEGSCIDLFNGELNLSKILQDQYVNPTVTISF